MEATISVVDSGRFTGKNAPPGEMFSVTAVSSSRPIRPLFVMNVVFGMAVEDLSEQALAHLGYWNMKFPRFVYPGDTLISSSEVLDKRESGSKPDRGIVHVRTTGVNQRGEEVCVYERKILVKKRAAYGGAA